MCCQLHNIYTYLSLALLLSIVSPLTLSVNVVVVVVGSLDVDIFLCSIAIFIRELQLVDEEA